MLSDSESEDDGISDIDTDDPLWQFVFFLMLWQGLYRVSNAAINMLFSFILIFVKVFGVALTGVESKMRYWPRTTSHASDLLWKKDKEDFTEYVVCPDCHSVYQYKDCVNTINGCKESNLCSHMAYPNHPHRSKQKQCGATLLKKVKRGSRFKLVPIKVYPYQSLKTALTKLVQKPGFLDNCEKWRRRVTDTEYLVDIYDGRIWSEYRSNGFLDSPFSLLLTMNVDWFQPFSHIQYSVGAIYLTVQNLPCSQRYKEENVILVGVMPGPSEPPLTMNSYLGPLVEDLNVGWNDGFVVKTHGDSEISLRIAVTCIACDIPASRKVCGFLGHNAALGCNKCFKKFNNVSLGHTDYSGFIQALIVKIGSADHVQLIMKVVGKY